ncbi:hypothetical protein EQO05_07110 [Methanosarcina sp. MSH10X1]|uniref:hypothetical protein n=1 Tax=Methanosarcina sp. MSH10X1 TaxID=2507075 RepID=UPI000FFBB6D2|nr:hypothetical protein [Methanosarcina sp. MSH10X1]RXA19910.1 hypothetical protein EQO05_07110 [Methanosarcina sp. MSH10X1]
MSDIYLSQIRIRLFGTIADCIEYDRISCVTVIRIKLDKCRNARTERDSDFRILTGGNLFEPGTPGELKSDPDGLLIRIWQPVTASKSKRVYFNDS